MPFPHCTISGSLVTSQEICSSPGTLPTPQLFLDRLSARQGDTAVLSCLVPLDSPMTCIVFCKEGKEISVQPKGGNKLVYNSPHPVSRESSWAFSCHYQLMDDNQENNSLPSDAWYLHVAGRMKRFVGPTAQRSADIFSFERLKMVMALEGMHRPKHQTQTSGQGVSGCRAAILPRAGQQQTVVSVLPLGKGSMAQGPAIPLWVWILSSTLILLLLVSTPIITCILRKRAVTQPIGKALGGMSGRKSQSWNNTHCHLLYQGLDRDYSSSPSAMLRMQHSDHPQDRNEHGR
ncbi:unnamed protein product [Caretta caretta]